MFRLGSKRRRARERLRELSLLKRLTDRDISFLSRYADAVEVEDGQVLAREGTAISQVVILVRGSATATMNGFSPQTLRPGDVVGIEILSEVDHLETVVVSEPAEILVIGRRQLAGLLRVAPSLSVALLEYVAGLLARRARTEVPTPTAW
jgi:CRP-like cAMP-binding protein